MRGRYTDWGSETGTPQKRPIQASYYGSRYEGTRVSERGRGRGRSPRQIYLGDISEERKKQQAETARLWMAQNMPQARRDGGLTATLRQRKAAEARRRTADTDERPINVLITNNSDYSIMYSIQSAIPSAAAKTLRLNPGTSADEYMRKDVVYGWPTLNLFYMPKSGPMKPIESYKPSKYIPNVHVTIKNDGDILDVQYEML